MVRQDSKTDLLYRQLRRKVSEMRNGSPFPTVRQLMAEYDVSQATVAPALNRLKQEGFLAAHVGRGTVVVKPDADRPKLRMVSPSWPSESLSAMVPLMKNAAESAGFDFSLLRYDYKRKFSEALEWQGADILVLDSLTVDQITQEHVRLFAGIPIPVILCRYSAPIREINYVCDDNTMIGGMTANYLYRKGHRKLGLLFNEPHVYTSERLASAFRQFSEYNGCEITFLDCGIRSGEKPDAAIHEFIRRFAMGKYDFSALFTVSCYGAVRVKMEMEHFGLKIPEDLSVLSNGDLPHSPWLTTVDDALQEHVDEVIQMARRLLEGNPMRNQVDVPVRILDRGSVLTIKNQIAVEGGVL